MLNLLKEEANRTLTENGAATHASSGSDCLDFFATCGAMRHSSDDKIVTRFLRAFAENRDHAMKLLFYARDVRGGLGERRVFRTCLAWLAVHAPESVRKNLARIPEYGRFDDLLVLMGTPCEADAIALIKTQLEADLTALAEGRTVSLLGKWLPSVNTSNRQAVLTGKRIARALGMSDAEYRKTLVKLRAAIRILENNLREKDYTFDYEKQPSKALFKYRKAFMKNDGGRYTAFLSAVERGEATLNAATLAPYELVDPYLSHYMDALSPEEAASLNTTWASLPDFGTEENALAVIDTSGSMYWATRPKPASVALSLGLYFAERNKGAFAGHFIEFSDEPQLIEIKGETFVDRLMYLSTFNRVANTNLQGMFDLVLDTAVKHNVPASELPSKLIIISDMEFDFCVEDSNATNFEMAKRKFEAAGYKLPDIVFWNVDARNTQQPVTMNEQGVVLVSGCTPRLFSMVAGGIVSPYVFMLEILGSERYRDITA